MENIEPKVKQEQKQKSEKTNKVLTVKNIICAVLIAIVLFVYLVIILNTITNKEKDKNIFLYKTCISVVDSENPKLSKGDLIILKAIDVSEINIGDAIVFEKQNNIFIKTVIDKKEKDGAQRLIINNDDLISNQNFSTEVKGKVVATIGGLGNVAIFIKTPIGTVVVFTIIICLVILIKKICNQKENTSNEE